MNHLASHVVKICEGLLGRDAAPLAAHAAASALSQRLAAAGGVLKRIQWLYMVMYTIDRGYYGYIYIYMVYYHILPIDIVGIIGLIKGSWEAYLYDK